MEKTLLLVDGSSYLYRAFHALPDLRNSKGEPTGALRGILAMLRKLRTDTPADYAACVFDARGKTFRDDWYPEYKANRPSMPEDLASQVPPIHQGVAALGWPVLSVPGVEADDVIGTLAVMAASHGIRTVIATGDKDLAQLVNTYVSLVDTMTRDGAPPKWLDEAGVLEKFGVPPTRIVDYLMLTGDTVDNVPGVEKVGPKTAVKWLAEFASIEGVVEQASTIKGVVGENLRKAIPQFELTRRLLTVKTDCDLADHLPNLEALAWRDPNHSQLLELFNHYEFKSWLAELRQPSAMVNVPVPVVPATRYITISTLDQFNTLLPRLRAAELVALDTETTSLDPMLARLVGLSFAFQPGEGFYLPLAHDYAGAPAQLPFAESLSALKTWLEDPACLKVGQHLKYDQQVLANYGIALRGIAHDTLLQSYVLESHLTHNLEDLATRHLGRDTLSYESVCGKGASQISFAQVSIEQATQYSGEDAEVTLQVHQTLWPRIQADEKLRYIYQQIELPVSTILQRIERNGVLVDAEMLIQQSAELGKRLLALEDQAYELAEQKFNLASPKQVGEILFGKLGLPSVKKTASGTPSTDEDVLAQLALDYPLPKLLLEHRSLAKLRGTYTDKLPKMINPETGRLHTRFSQAIAVTGRLSSSDPNLQNIPIRTAEGRRIREAFIAPPGCALLSADYSQIELRIMAHLSNDPGLLSAFSQGLDVHRATASEVFGLPVDEVNADQRRVAKAVNFGLIYGMSAFGLAQNLGIDRSTAALYIERYFSRYPGVAQYMEATRQKVREQGFVETVFGRRLALPDIRSHQAAKRSGAERAAINAPMQGTAADLIKLAMIAVQKHLDEHELATRMVLQVHDELVFEVPEGELERVRRELGPVMEGVADLAVKLIVEIGVGHNWESAH